VPPNFPCFLRGGKKGAKNFFFHFFLLFLAAGKKNFALWGGFFWQLLKNLLILKINFKKTAGGGGPDPKILKTIFQVFQNFRQGGAPKKTKNPKKKGGGKIVLKIPFFSPRGGRHPPLRLLFSHTPRFPKKGGRGGGEKKWAFSPVPGIFPKTGDSFFFKKRNPICG